MSPVVCWNYSAQDVSVGGLILHERTGAILGGKVSSRLETQLERRRTKLESQPRPQLELLESQLDMLESQLGRRRTTLESQPRPQLEMLESQREMLESQLERRRAMLRSQPKTKRTRQPSSGRNEHSRTRERPGSLRECWFVTARTIPCKEK